MDIKIYLKLKIWILKHDLKHDEKKDFTLCPSLKKIGKGDYQNEKTGFRFCE